MLKIFLAILLYVTAHSLEKAEYTLLTFLVFSVFIAMIYWAMQDILVYFGYR